MGFKIPTLAFELANIGLTPRRRMEVTKPYDPHIVFFDEAKSHYLVCLDENGEYTFSNEMLQSDRSYQEFYDGEHKVLEVFYNDHGLILNILSDKQTNLFIDLTVNECIIKASGPLCIDGKLKIKSTLAISANALCFLDAIDFDGVASLTIQQGVGLLAPFRVKKLSLTAAYLYQSADISIGQYDLSVQAFQQVQGSKTHINALRLVSEQCEIVGEFYVHKSCFLAANNLLIGDGKSVTRFDLPIDHHIHVVNSVTRGQSSIVVGRASETAIQRTNQTTQWLVDESFFVDKRASLVLHNTRFDANKIESRGDWSLSNCVINAQLTNLRGGNFVLSHSDLVGDKVNVFSASITIDNHSRIELNESLITDESAHFMMNKSTAQIQNKILLFGTIIMNRSKVYADNFRAYQTITLKKTQITSKTFFELQGALYINNVAIQSKMVFFTGVLDIDDVIVNAATVNYQSQQGRIVKNFIKAESVSILGSEVEGNMIIIESRLVFNNVSIKQYVAVKNTSLIGIDDADICHNIEGQLTLDQSQFITQSQLHSLVGSHLKLCEHSGILSGIIDSKGDINTQDSAIYCDALLQYGASISAKSSKIHIDKALKTQNAEMMFDEGSMVSAAEVTLRQRSNLRLKGVSVLAAREQVILGSDTTLQSNDSIVCARKFSIFGRTELCASLLSAQELLIYDRFYAQDKTVIHVDEQISFAKTAQVRLTSSNMTGHDIETLGVLDVIDSRVQAEQSISFWSASSTSLQGQTSVVAEDAILRGKLVTKKKSTNKDEASPDSTKTPILQIKKQMDISPLGHIIGDEALFIDADLITQSGTIELTGNFSAQGKQYNNIGSVTAPSISLGFDDTVINHGLFSSKKMTVHSNFMNILGQVYAQETLSCSGFISVNLGLIAANNYTNDSFFSLNAGLITPNFSADPNYLFSTSNLFSVAKTAAMTILPAYTNAIQLVSMIPSVFSTVENLYSLYNKLGFESLKKMRRHEMMPILCQAKNVAMFGRGLVNAGSAFGNEFEGFRTLINDPMTWMTDTWSAMEATNWEKMRAQAANTYTDTWTKLESTDWGMLASDTYSDTKSFLEAADWEKVGMQAAGAFTGSYSENSLFHVNVGASFGSNTSKTSIFHVNTGIEQSAFLHNINTYYLYNSGTSAGREASFSATQIRNKGTLKGTNQYSVRADIVDNGKTGVLEGERANIEIGELHQDGQLIIDEGRLNITVFTDSHDSHTTLTNVAINGTTLDLTGDAKLTNVYIHEEEHFITTADSKLETDNVTIETKTFTQGGALDYAHGLTIKADTATFQRGSVVCGQRTTEDELFVPKPMDSKTESKTKDHDLGDDASQEASEENAETVKEAEKEFNPQHVLTVQAQKLTLGGKLSGGDYSQLEGKKTTEANADRTPADAAVTNEVIIDDSADIDLKYGSISAKKGDVSGTVVLDSFNVAIKEGVLNQSSTVTLKKSSYTGDSLLESGSLILDHSSVNVTHTHLTQQGHELLVDSTMSSQHIVDESQMSYQGQSGIVTDAYEHTGYVSKVAPPEGSEEKNLFYVKAKTATLNGSTNLDNGYYDIEHLGDGTQFAAGTGRYSLYLSSESLSYKTQDSFRLYDSIQRHCDVSVEAADIVYGGTHNQQHDLTFISTLGDVALTSAIQSRNLFVKSAKNIYTNSSINTESSLSFEAAGGYYNYGGTLNGNDVAVKASEIKNYTRGSNGAVAGTVLPMGGAGIINARNNLFLQATQGNIEDHGGILRAGNYAQLLASGDVLNLCNIRTYQGQYSLLQQFDGGLISGGCGKDTDGIGLYIKAEGQVISDASDFVSNGSNYIEGVRGVQFTARSHTAITKYETSETWYGKKKTVVETSTVIKGCYIQSSNGRNIIQSGEGSVSSVASRFISPGGTDISAKGDVKLFSLRTQDRHIESISKLWGLSKKETDSLYKSATPTLFYDNGATRIYSSEGSVDARGAYFVGSGDLCIKAKKKILFGVDILNHEVNEKSNTFSVSAPGVGAWNAYHQGGNAWDIVTSEDATLAKMNSLYGSNNAAELLANSSNLGIDLCNTTNSVMRGLGEGGLGSELMARYGLGGAAGFSPSVILSMTQSKTKSTFQTQSQGGVDRGGNVVLEAGESVILENGVRVHAGGNLEVDAPVLIAQAAELKSSMTQTIVSESIGIAPLSGQAQSVGASYSKTHSESTTYRNAELSAGGNIFLHNQDKAMERVELDGANISSKTLDMNTDTLVIRDRQDTSQTSSESLSVNSSGQFSVYEGKGHEKVTHQSSGIYVVDGINTDGHKVHAGETYMEGGKIITDGENHFETDKMVSQSLTDEKIFNGIGISGNINDLSRLMGQKPANIAGEQAIATAALAFDHVDYKATQQSVVYGAQGTYLDVKELLGDAIHTTSSDGKVVQHDDAMHLHVDIPITNQHYLKASTANIKAGGAELADLFMPSQHHNEPVDVGRGGPILPVEDKKEEKDLEDEILDDPKDKHAKKPGHHPKKGGSEFDLTPEETKEIVGEALQHIQFDSPKKKAEFQKTIEKANHEIEKNGKVSLKTESNLKKQVTEALIKTLKAGSEYKWGKLIDKLGPDYEKTLIKMLSNPETAAHVGIKTYMGSKGVVISFVYNLALSSMDSEVKKGDVIKHAAVTTGVDITFDFVVQVLFRQASGSVGTGMFVFSVMDSFYDQDRIDAQNTSGVSYLYESQKLSQQGHPLDAWATRQAAADQMGTAARTQAAHDLAKITQPIVERIENKWNEFRSKPKQTTKAPTAVDAKQSSQGMFKSIPSRQGTDEYKFDQLGIQ